MRKFIYFLFIGVLFISGCNQNEARDITSPTDRNNLITVNQANNDSKKEMTEQQLAEYLVNLTKRVPNINDATAVVVGDYAVVGIDVDKRLDRSRVGSIKYSVAEALHHDPVGANAVVVADADTFERLQKMGKEIENGRPIQGVIEELAGIVGRLMPQIPSEINSNKKPTEQNDNQLPKADEKQLDQIQNKQSKNNL